MTLRTDESMREFRVFWTRALGLSARELATRGFVATTSGAYVDRHQDKYIFLFQDLVTKKRVIAGSAARLARVRMKTLPLKRLAFDDIDYGFKRKSQFRSVELRSETLRILPLTGRHKKAIKEFSKRCSAEDRDTLDLAFENEYAVALFDGQRILGIARYAKIRKLSKLVDITVMVEPRARGRGYSTPLVSKLIKKIFARGLVPKYRVGRSNFPSRAIAENLGLVPLFSLKTYR